MRAVILAAGQGSRLKPLTDSCPKCLLSVGGQSILEWQLDALSRHELTEVIIVTGFKEDMIRSFIESKPYPFSIRLVHNADWASTNNNYSLCLALQTFEDSFFLLNGDTVFHPDILDELINSPNANVLACHYKEVNSEEMQVITDGTRILDIDKDIKGSAEFTGIALFRNCFFSIKLATELTDRNLWFENALESVLDQADIRAQNIFGIPYIEVDFPEDLAKASELFITGMPDWEIGIRHGSNLNPENAINLLQDVIEEFNREDICCWLNWGLLLGVVRDGDFIPWDTDLDITCHMKDRAKVISIIEPRLRKKNIWVVKESVCYYEDRWYIKDEEKVELNFVEDCGDKYVYSPNRCKLAIPKPWIDHLDTVNFYGYIYNIPSHAEEYLEGSYGPDWKTPIRGKKPRSL